MKSKIFKHIFLVAMAVFVSCIALTMCSLYSYFSAEHNAEMKEEANYVAAAVEENGIDFLRHRRTSSTTRVTWIDTDGTVLYDSVANPAEMENHGERGGNSGSHEAGSWGEQPLFQHPGGKDYQLRYPPHRRHPSSGISATQYTVVTLIVGMFSAMVAVLILAILLSLFLASPGVQKCHGTHQQN